MYSLCLWERLEIAKEPLFVGANSKGGGAEIQNNKVHLARHMNSMK